MEKSESFLVHQKSSNNLQIGITNLTRGIESRGKWGNGGNEKSFLVRLRTLHAEDDAGYSWSVDGSDKGWL